ERASEHGRAVVVAAHGLHLIEGSSQPRRCAREIGELAYRAAVGVDGNFVVGAEGPDQCGKGLVHLLHRGVGHAEIEQDGEREFKRIAAEERKLLLLAVLVEGEIFWEEAIDKASVAVLYRNRDLDEVGRDYEFVELLFVVGG